MSIPGRATGPCDGNAIGEFVKSAADTYAGKWLLRKAQIGRERVEDSLGPTILLFSKDRYVLKNGNTIEKGYITVDLGKTPPTMDLEAQQGANAGRRQLAIFEVSADRLKLSYSLADGDRPSSFFSGEYWHLLSAEYVRIASRQC
jgi:uncharacterized protein (TIGR03067 family)